MADLLQRSSGLQPLVDGVSQVHANDLQHVNGIGLHGWVYFARVGDQVSPMCCCGHVGPFALTVDAAYELTCERLELERASVARLALLHG